MMMVFYVIWNVNDYMLMMRSTGCHKRPQDRESQQCHYLNKKWKKNDQKRSEIYVLRIDVQ